MRRCISHFASSAMLASPVTTDAVQKKATNIILLGSHQPKDLFGRYIPIDAKITLQEAAQTRGFKSPLWLTKEAAMEIRCYGGLQEGAVPVRVGDKGLYYNIEQTVHPDAQPMQSLLKGFIYPQSVQDILCKHSTERGFTSRFWVTTKQLALFKPPLTLKEDAQPTALLSGKGHTYNIYNVDQIVEGDVVAKHLAAKAPPSSS